MNEHHRIAAIAWSPHCQRTSNFARRLNASFYPVHYLKSKRPWLAPLKYILQWIKTWILLSRQRPSLIYVAVSPIVAALSVYVYCLFSGARFIMDVHGNSMTSRKWKWSIPLHRFLARRALVNIVDQEVRTRLFTSWQAKTVVLERPPLVISREDFQSGSEPRKQNITIVNTFNADEPIVPILEAAQQLPEVAFYILGDTTLANKSLLKAAPANVTFTGYLRGDEYWRRLCSANAVMVLTTQPYSLLAGAQEGMAAGRPLILSRQPALVNYFTKGTVFIDHTVESIVSGVQKAIVQEAHLQQESLALAHEKRHRWEAEFQQLLHLIGNVPC